MRGRTTDDGPRTTDDGPRTTHHAPRTTRICLLLLVTLAFLVRLAPLGRYVTPDEPMWVQRSVQFADALAAGDWASVPVTGHPGVTTMWLGAAGVGLQRLLAPAESAAHLDWLHRLAWLTPENGEAFRHLAFFLPFGRVAVALATTLGLLLASLLTARRFGWTAALLMSGLLAFDPLLVGHSGLLHTDALLSTFVLLALLAAFNGLDGPRPALWWGLAGLFSALATLSKTPGVMAAGFLMGLLAVRAIPVVVRRQPQPALWSLATCALAFLVAFVLALFALYPALWADPAGVVQTLGAFAGRHVEMTQRPIFFAGRLTYDPGPVFYPAVLLFRASPLLLVGLVIGLARLRRIPADGRFVLLTLLAFAVLFVTMMSLGAKKHDRYVLPAIPPLTLAVAVALSASPRLRVSRSPYLLVPLLSLVLLLPFVTCPLAYANPLLGGPPVAARVLSLDWGEGMGAAARWLNRQPGAEQMTVAAASVPGFASLFVGRTVPLDSPTAPLADFVADFAPSGGLPVAYTARLGFLDHAVLLTNTASFEQAAWLAAHAGPDDLILLDADAPLLRYYEGPGRMLSAAALPDEPAVAAWLTEQAAGRSSIWLVSLPGASPVTAAQLRRQVEALAAPLTTTAVASATLTRYAPRPTPPVAQPAPYRALFAGQMALVDGVAGDVASGPDPLRVTLRWRALGLPSTGYRVAVTLRDGEGEVWSSADEWLLDASGFRTSDWAADEWNDATVLLELPPGIPPDQYMVDVGLYDGVTGAGLGAARPDGTFCGTRIPFTVTVSPPTAPPDLTAVEEWRRLDRPVGPFTLLGLREPPTTVLSGDRLSFALFWQADEAPQADYRVRLRLVDEAGEVVLETAPPLSPYPTSRWQAGQRFQSRYTLRIPPDLPPGPYRLGLNVLDGAGNPLWQADEGLGNVEVLPRERLFTLPEEIPYPLAFTFGGLVHLRGYRLDSAATSPGGALTLTLYWQAERPAERDYTLFVHLLGPDGRAYGQVDRVPGAGQSPTSSWAAGQVIVDEVVLPVAADAPPGTYHIAVGFYDAAYGDRLPVADPAGQPLPGDQATLPSEVSIASPGGAE
jgi:4-amino-4-deoxy-L-arabinose transferase-like glycosyltransferase